MEMHPSESAARAWVEASAGRASFGHVGAVLFLGAVAYALLEFLTNLNFINLYAETHRIQIDSWDFEAGMDHSDAATIVGTLAAFVVTINVAVFAARLGGPADLRGEMDLGRWQHVMEWLAPLSAAAALAVAATRIPSQPGLGAGLLALAVITVCASDVTVAGRLRALHFEADIAAIAHEQAKLHLESFIDGLPPHLQRRVPEDLRSVENRFLSLVLVILMLETFGYFWALELSTPSGFGVFTTAILEGGYYSIIGIMGATTITMLSASEFLTQRLMWSSSPRVKELTGIRAGWMHMSAITKTLAVLVALSLVSSLLIGGHHRLLSATTTAIGSATGCAVILIAGRLGRGPGISAIWRAVHRLRLNVHATDQKAHQAAQARDAARALHVALQGAQDLDDQTLQDKVVAIRSRGSRRQALRRTQRRPKRHD